MFATKTKGGVAVVLGPSAETGHATVYARFDLGDGKGERRVGVWKWDDENDALFAPVKDHDYLCLSIPKADFLRAKAEAETLLAAQCEPIPEKLPPGWDWLWDHDNLGIGVPVIPANVRQPNPEIYSGDTCRAIIESADPDRIADLRDCYVLPVAKRNGAVLVRPLTDAEWAGVLSGLTTTEPAL